MKEWIINALNIDLSEILKPMSKVILITGASSGLGGAIAAKLASQGHKVYGTSRKASTSNLFNMIQMDVQDQESVEKAVKQIVEENGKLDILINNAGLGIAGPVEHLDLETTQKAFDTNFFGVLRTCQVALPLLRSSQGKIINISSIGSMFGLPYRGAYCATKAAVNMLTETLRMETKQFGVQSTSVLAGDMKTAINNNRLTTDLKKESPYYANYTKVYEGIDADVDSGVSVEYVASKISGIVDKRKIKRYYAIGKPLQKVSILVKKLLPDYLFEKIIMGYSGL